MQQRSLQNKSTKNHSLNAQHSTCATKSTEEKGAKSQAENKVAHAKAHGKASFFKRLYLTGIALLMGGCLVLGALSLLTVYWAAPSLEKFHMRSNVLYDREGQLVYEMLSPDEYHRILTLPEQVDPLYIKMLLASEDERFYEHWGVDPISIARALVSNIMAGQRVSGASTLAMQICRLLEPKERTLLSKIKEALGAVYLTAKFGREQILTMYLTLAPFGGNIEGVTAASYSYFNHGPEHLTPAEAALLVALPRSPEKIRPDRHHRAALYYRNEVLTKAVTDGVIKQDILESATKEGVPQFTYELPREAFHLGQSIFAGKLHPLLSELITTNQAFMTPMDSSCPAFGYAQPLLAESSQSAEPIVANANADINANKEAHDKIAKASKEPLAEISEKTNADINAETNEATNEASNAGAPTVSASTESALSTHHTNEGTGEILKETMVSKHSPTLADKASKRGQGKSNDATLNDRLQAMPLSLKLRFDLQGRRLPTEVYTTLDSKVQKTLLETMQGYQATSLNRQAQESMGMLAVDNQSFEVIGYASSDNSFVDMIQAQRSPGSALKPFAYALAFEQGLMHPNSVLLDLGKIYRTYQPRNYDRMFFGEITAAQALQGSLNLPALEVMRAVGPVNFVDRLNSFPNTITNRYLVTPQYERMQEVVVSPSVVNTSTVSTSVVNASTESTSVVNTGVLNTSLEPSKLNSTRTASMRQGNTALEHVSSSPNSKLLSNLVHPDQEPSRFINSASAALMHPSSFSPDNYIRGRIKLMPNTTPHIGVILGACSISLYDLTQLYASLAHDGQIKPLNVLSEQRPRNKSSSLSSTDMTRNDGKTNGAGHEQVLASIESIESLSNQGSSEGEYSIIHPSRNRLDGADEGSIEGTVASAVESADSSVSPVPHESNKWTTFLDKDTARATFAILEGLPHPAGFNYDEKIRISYKTGTSFKYRDTVALGSRGAITVGVWQGRPDGNPSKLNLSAYEKTAPILFRVLTLLPERKVFKPLLPQTGVLQRKPPQALAQLEIKTLGLTGLRRTNELEQERSFTQGVPLEIVYPSDGMHIKASLSGRILLQIQGGKPPYYVLLDGQELSEHSFFEPTHNGIYTITVIDSSGQSQEVQIWVEGVQEETVNQVES